MFRKIDLYIKNDAGDWVYAYSTNRSRTCRGAAARYEAANPGVRVRARFAKGN